MALVKEMLAGYARTVRIDNHLRKQDVELTHLPLMQEKIARTLNELDERLAADPKLAKRFATIKLTLPSD